MTGAPDTRAFRVVGWESKDPENVWSVDAASGRSHETAWREFPEAGLWGTACRGPSTRPRSGFPDF
jgi:hypothetical protein